MTISAWDLSHQKKKKKSISTDLIWMTWIFFAPFITCWPWSSTLFSNRTAVEWNAIVMKAEHVLFGEKKRKWPSLCSTCEHLLLKFTSNFFFFFCLASSVALWMALLVGQPLLTCKYLCSNGLLWTLEETFTVVSQCTLLTFAINEFSLTLAPIDI